MVAGLLLYCLVFSCVVTTPAWIMTLCIRRYPDRTKTLWSAACFWCPALGAILGVVLHPGAFAVVAAGPLGLPVAGLVATAKTPLAYAHEAAFVVCAALLCIIQWRAVWSVGWRLLRTRKMPSPKLLSLLAAVFPAMVFIPALLLLVSTCPAVAQS